MVCAVAAGPLSLVVQGIDGKDLADANPKLTKAVLWQLMRLHALKILMGLGVSEKKILSWASSRLKAAGFNEALKSFSDQALQSGVLLLQLLALIAPECVSREQVTLAAPVSPPCVSCVVGQACTSTPLHRESGASQRSHP